MANSEIIPASGKAPEFPELVVDWNNWIRANDHSLSSLERIDPKSGSKAPVAQFYMLRTLYIKPQSCEADLGQTLTESSFLSEISAFEYDTIAESHGVEDEEIVNFALVLFANSLIGATSSVNVDGDWLPCRSSFHVQFKNKELYKALVDGIFRVEKVAEEKVAEQLSQCRRLNKTGSTTSNANDNDNDSYKLSKNSKTTAIMEVKRNSRSNTENWCVEIFYQEAAEMAAWIADVPMLLDQKPDHNGTYRLGQQSISNHQQPVNQQPVNQQPVNQQPVKQQQNYGY
ncbi:hypothetical protein ARSEF1564_010033 [Beauveria bassiana]